MKMNILTRSKRKIKATKFLIFIILSFLFVYCFNYQTTAFNSEITLGWTLIATFIKSYLGLVMLYFLFKIWNVFQPLEENGEEAIRKQFYFIIKTFQKVFLWVLAFQVSIELYALWNHLGLYPIELGFWDSVWTLFRYLVGLFGTWILEFWFWIGKQLRISFLLNNPCLGGICLEEYPWVSVLLTLMLGYVMKKLWNISFIQGAIKFFFQLVYRVFRTVFKFIISRISKSASKQLSSSLFVKLWKATFTDLKSIYQFSDEENKLEGDKGEQYNFPSSENTKKVETSNN